VVFHFNKASIGDASIPPWVLKVKGQTHYVWHVSSTASWSTKETPDNDHTKGSLKLRNVNVVIDDQGHAEIEKRD
jgi:hypothetical protein